jgi:hypothetical protein
MKTSKKKRQKRDPLDTLYRKRDRALERVVALWDKSGAPDDDPEDLNRALDVLTLAHTAATFEFVGG